MRSRSKILIALLFLILLTSYNIYINYNNKKIKIYDNIKNKFIENIVIPINTINSNNNNNDILVNNNLNLNNDNINEYDKLSCSVFNLTAQQYKVTIDDITYPKIVPYRDNATIDFNCINKLTKPKLILLWTPFYDRDDFYYGLGKYQPFKDHGCPAYNCEITKDKSRLNESDIVVVSFQNKIDPIPKDRRADQQWVFVIIESPVHLNGFNSYNNIFNLAVTYRLDADFVSHYAYESHMAWQENPNFDPNYDYYNGKTEFAAIVVSNCGGSSGRLPYVNEMKKYVDVKIYGACGQQCPSKFDNGTAADCKVIIGHKFKFFLAFENSLCKDYITEKFFIILRYNIIPVVLGAGIYENYVPKSGFINVLDYKSPKELTDYLLYLDKNRTAYNSYFQWKKHVYKKYDGIFAAEVCEFCIKAHIDAYTGVKNKKLIDNFGQYWNSGIDCKAVANYPQLIP